MDTVLMYTCGACPPEGINMHKVYGYGKDKKGEYLIDGEKRIDMESELIHMLFTPKDTDWASIGA